MYTYVLNICMYTLIFIKPVYLYVDYIIYFKDLPGVGPNHT